MSSLSQVKKFKENMGIWQVKNYVNKGIIFIFNCEIGFIGGLTNCPISHPDRCDSINELRYGNFQKAIDGFIVVRDSIIFDGIYGSSI